MAESSDSYRQSNILLESGTNEVEFLEFYLGSGRYGVNVAKVTQVVVFDPEQLAELPGEQQQGILGTIMFRDDPILITDLSALLNVSCDDDRGPRLLLVLEFNRRTTGFVVDGVNAIRRVSWDEFKQTDESNVGAQTQWVTGVVALEDQMTLVLDFEALLGSIVPSVSPEAYGQDIALIEAVKDKETSVIYCEDSEIVQKVALRAFAQAGISNIKVFTSGRDGLAYLLENRDNPCDLIVSDIEMPMMDGFTLCRRVKSDPSYKDVPFVFFSSTISEATKRKCESVGATAAFSKPEINQLVDAIGDLLSS